MRLRLPTALATAALLTSAASAQPPKLLPAPIEPQPVVTWPVPVVVPEPAAVGPSTGGWSVYGVPALALQPGYVWYPPSVRHPVPGMWWPWHTGPLPVPIISSDAVAQSTPAPPVDKKDPLDLLDAGAADVRAGRLAEAKAKFEAAVTLDVQEGRAWAALAVVNHRLGNAAAADEAAVYAAAVIRSAADRALGVYDSISRVQGAARRVLTAAEDRVPNEDEARVVLGRKPTFGK
jgi:hypothetical protein